ncbi:MAG: hypothetical protein GY742_14385 [Hyphomicrobiales bacterium]|nr:hypothetical protein [Hyphomicrobiales bacterium]
MARFGGKVVKDFDGDGSVACEFLRITGEFSLGLDDRYGLFVTSVILSFGGVTVREKNEGLSG